MFLRTCVVYIVWPPHQPDPTSHHCTATNEKLSLAARLCVAMYVCMYVTVYVQTELSSPLLHCSLSHMITLCIQEFLNDYGMMWVGKEEDVDGREPGDRCPGQVTVAMWNPATSVTGNPTASSTVKFDTIVKNIKVHMYMHTYDPLLNHIQWNLSIEDTIGTQLAVLYTVETLYKGRHWPS